MAPLKVREALRAWAEEAAKLRGLLRVLCAEQEAYFQNVRTSEPGSNLVQSLASMVPRMASRSKSAGLL